MSNIYMKPYAHQVLLLGLENHTLVVPIHNVYWYVSADYFITLTVAGFDLQNVRSSNCQITSNNALSRFSYCLTDCPNIHTAYDIISLGYNAFRVMVGECEIINDNPLTIRFHEDQFDRIQLGKPQL